MEEIEKAMLSMQRSRTSECTNKAQMLMYMHRLRHLWNDYVKTCIDILPNASKKEEITIASKANTITGYLEGGIQMLEEEVKYENFSKHERGKNIQTLPFVPIDPK